MAGLTSKSVFLSLLLRHKPEVVGLKLESGGWLDVDQLLHAVIGHKKAFNKDDLIEIVNSDTKGRYSFSPGGISIRANQGHSIAVDVGMVETVPPEFLYHGTAAKSCGSIRKNGLNAGSRLHVHMSSNKETAYVVGARHGLPVVLVIDSERMAKDGVPIYLSENGVYLTNVVDTKYILE